MSYCIRTISEKYLYIMFFVLFSDIYELNGRSVAQHNGVTNGSLSHSQSTASGLSHQSGGSSGLSHGGGSRTMLTASTMSLVPTYDAMKSLAAQVVAYHLCQADNNITCMVPEFVHSIAAYLTQAPQLSPYRDLLLQEPHLQNILSMKECVHDPSRAFIKGIIDPLLELKQMGKIKADMCVILIDSLNEAEFHKPDYGDTLASFLTRHMHRVPSWIRWVVTVRTVLQDLCKFMPFQRLSIEKSEGRDYVKRDLMEYLNYRINNSANIRNNISLEGRLEPASQQKFSTHVLELSRGCLLYCKLLLNLIEKGRLVLKSSNFKILPVNLSEVFQLHFNLKFPSTRSFEKVVPILNICLASLYPLTMTEIYEALNSGYLQRYVQWEEFEQRMEVMDGFLCKKRDSSYMYFHPAFREWLIRREERDSTRFLCDLR